MADWETDWSCDALERIVALLFALANLADRAAGAPYLRRRHVLGILSHGEAEARAFVIETVTGVPVPAEASKVMGEAANLAVRFRSLALALCVLLAQATPSAPRVAVGPQADRPSHRISGAVRWLDGPPYASDTS